MFFWIYLSIKFNFFNVTFLLHFGESLHQYSGLVHNRFVDRRCRRCWRSTCQTGCQDTGGEDLAIKDK